MAVGGAVDCREAWGGVLSGVKFKDLSNLDEIGIEISDFSF